MLQKMIPVDHVKNVHELPLVLMYAFHLDVKEGIWVNFNVAMFSDPSNKSLLIVSFDPHKFLEENLVFSLWF